MYVNNIQLKYLLNTYSYTGPITKANVSYSLHIIKNISAYKTENIILSTGLYETKNHNVI